MKKQIVAKEETKNKTKKEPEKCSVTNENNKMTKKEGTKTVSWIPLEKKSKTPNKVIKIKRKDERLSRKVKKSIAETNKLLAEADSVFKAIDTINSNYRESKSVIKVKLNSNSHEYSDAQVLEKAQINHFAERISRSLEGLKQIESEVEKTVKFSREIAEEAEKSWYIRWLRYIY
ncbi:unnamed protein product [Caenorhabditis angaria]|uniref:Uncharacterized protein n=1 Tax=Caenorhabditis angaria TaxID=860376 RepID=A0A9P1I5C9_9PELO|nr:unnamed protein product [Caenorhabditis angaria]